jgi:hypothetical protein
MNDINSIENKILEWLSKEGYPLEFKVANIFRANRFLTFQGQYVKDFKTDIPREIDVLAQVTSHVEKSFLRICYVVECKWTENKPWVIFTDQNSHIAPAACIAQSIATTTADAILWILASDKDVQELSIFRTPDRPGFNGRQAFGSQNDIVYSTLQSIMSSCYSKKRDYESYHKKPEDSLGFGVIFIPLIVIEGRLFETFYNKQTQKIDILEKDQIRLHWRGSEAWHLHSTIDIVTIESLPDYVNKLSLETDYLINKMAITFQLIMECIKQKNLDPIKSMTSVSRGVLGIPPLLKKIIMDKE